MKKKTAAEAHKWWLFGGFGVLGLHRWWYLGFYSGLLFPVFIIGGFGSAIEDGSGGTALVALIALGLAIVDRWRIPTLVEKHHSRVTERENDPQLRASEIPPTIGEAGAGGATLSVNLEQSWEKDRLNPFQARYAGVCEVCRGPIAEGQMIYAREDWGACHTACGERAGWVTGDPADTPRGEDLKVLSAKYGGLCKVCGYPLHKGTEIYAVFAYGAAHRQCGEASGWVPQR